MHCVVGGLCVKGVKVLHSNGHCRDDDEMQKKTLECFGIGTRAQNSPRVKGQFHPFTAQPQEHKQGGKRQGQQRLRSQSLLHSR